MLSVVNAVKRCTYEKTKTIQKCVKKASSRCFSTRHYHVGRPMLQLSVSINEHNNDSCDNRRKSVVTYQEGNHCFSVGKIAKLRRFSRYKIVVEVAEEQSLQYIILGGRKHNNFHINHNLVNSSKVYTVYWSSDQVKTVRRRHCNVMLCSIKLEHYIEFQFKLLVKFCHDEEHC